MTRTKKTTIDPKKNENLESFFNSSPKEPEKKKKRASWKGILTLLLLVAAIASAGYFGKKYYDLKKNPQIEVKKEEKMLTDQISKLMLLPEGENPTIADVVDKEKLKDQRFFQKAENGDKVLVYPQAQQAILFRPSINKIINVAPVYQKEKDSSQSITVEPQKDIAADTETSPDQSTTTVTLLNGSSTGGLANKTEQMIKESLSQLEVTHKANANKQNYGKTIVSDLSGTHQRQAEQLAELLDGTVEPFPTEERPPSSDVAVILAK